MIIEQPGESNLTGLKRKATIRETELRDSVTSEDGMDRMGLRQRDKAGTEAWWGGDKKLTANMEHFGTRSKMPPLVSK